jgi:hypothetical protein
MYAYNQSNNGAYPGNAIVPGMAPHKGTQPLTQSEIDMLMNEVNKTEWRVSELDLIKAKCTHRDKQGNATLVEAGDDKVKCKICGEEFHLLQDDLTTIQKHTEYVIDALQTIKTMYLDAPEQLSNNYFQIIPMLQKTVLLYKKAADNLAQHDNSQSASIYPTNFNADPNSWQMMGSILAGNTGYGYGMPNPAQPNPAMNQPIPGMYVNGQFVPQGGVMNYPGGINPMTGAPMAATPQAQAPAANIPPVQPQQQTATQPVTQTKTFDV